MRIKIGTRGSKLALAQSEWVKVRIQERYPKVRIELDRIRTRGDKILDAPLSRIGGKGLFVKEIEEILLSGRADLAVHSMKDVPAQLMEGLILTAFPKRENPHDVLISKGNHSLQGLPKGVRVGTSSLRRGAQVRHIRPDLEIVPLRGNVDTRLKKLKRGEFQAIVLAAAGIYRLGLGEETSAVIPEEQILPAVGQGALGLEVRAENREVIELLSFMNDTATELTVKAERAFLKELEGGCQVPIAALARLMGDKLILDGMVAELDGSRVIRERMEGDKGEAEQIGVSLARRLLEAGAREILDRIYEKVGVGGDGRE